MSTNPNTENEPRDIRSLEKEKVAKLLSELINTDEDESNKEDDPEEDRENS
jgi:hypothetical protein